jgi:hypothetical protein
MIVVVESNFVLELAFRQEQIAAVDRIVELASRREIELAIPACALFEPFETLLRRERERNNALRSLRDQMTVLGRSAHFPDLKKDSEGFARLLAASVETEADALDDAIHRILGCAQVIPLSGDIMRESFRAREQFSFEPQDSVVFSSVDSFLNQRGRPASIFANKNSRDFAVREVKKHFGDLNCKVLSTFAAAVGVIGQRASGAERG